MSALYLGNLTVRQMEDRLGIKFTDTEKEFLTKSRKSRISDIGKDNWHCYDIPFVMECGSMEFATDVYNLLKHHQDQIIEPMQIAIK
jgi:hypothetical protein